MRMILNRVTKAKFIVDMSCFPLENYGFFKNFIRESSENNDLATNLHIFSNPCFFSPRTKIANLHNPTQVIIAARTRNPNSNLIVELYEK
jgi:UDP-glucose 6-dehydrogenase